MQRKPKPASRVNGARASSSMNGCAASNQAPPSTKRRPALLSFHTHSLTLPAMSAVPNGPRLPEAPTGSGPRPPKLLTCRTSEKMPSAPAARYQWNIVGRAAAGEGGIRRRFVPAHAAHRQVGGCPSGTSRAPRSTGPAGRCASRNSRHRLIPRQRPAVLDERLRPVVPLLVAAGVDERLELPVGHLVGVDPERRAAPPRRARRVLDRRRPAPAPSPAAPAPALTSVSFSGNGIRDDLARFVARQREPPAHLAQRQLRGQWRPCRAPSIPRPFPRANESTPRRPSGSEVTGMVVSRVPGRRAAADRRAARPARAAPGGRRRRIAAPADQPADLGNGLVAHPAETRLAGPEPQERPATRSPAPRTAAAIQRAARRRSAAAARALDLGPRRRRAPGAAHVRGRSAPSGSLASARDTTCAESRGRRPA